MSFRSEEFMNFEEGLLHLQDFIRKKPTIIVGTGLSLSMRLPGMSELLEHLKFMIPQRCNENRELLSEWDDCIKLIEQHGFEDGLNKITICDELLDFIILETARIVQRKDSEAHKLIPQMQISDYPFAKLLKHLVESLSPSNPTLNIITPNYDHLVEYACDLINVNCCTGFKGSYILKFDLNHLKTDIYRTTSFIDRRGPNFKKVPRVRLLKPHGSLYWQRINDETIESYQIIDGAKPVIITPGSTKFKTSLIDPIMNAHREMANECIQKSDSILIIGYGFNDVHLQTVLMDKLRAGVDCLILTKWLSPTAKELIASFKQIIALEEDGHLKTRWHYNQQEGVWDDPIWSLDQFVKRVI